MSVQEERATLVYKRSLVKRIITNLECKIPQLASNEEVTYYDMVCAKQFLCDIRNLDQQFQSIVLDNSDAVEKDNDELESHDDRVRENSNRLTYFMTSKLSSSAMESQCKQT